MKNPMNRRTFIQTKLGVVLTASAFPALIPSRALGQVATSAPNQRINAACIGVGPQGRGVMSNFLAQKDCRVVAVCDVMKTNLEAARGMVNGHYQNQDCQTYHDFNELLARKDIDVVSIATPDHWHVPAAVAAAKAGKDVYLEKPMGLSLQEDFRLRETVKKHGRMFQFGTQQRSSGQFRQACELVRNGRIGKLKQINVWCAASRPGGSTQPAPVPEGLNYDRWLGPAAYSPFTVDRCTDTPGWKTWWYTYDFALGFIAGWGVHPLDIALWGYPEMFKAPMQVEGKAIFPQEGMCNTSIAWDIQYGCTGDVVMRYKGVRSGYDQINELNDMSEWEKKYGGIADHGTAFEGTEGWVLVDRTTIRTHPEKLVEEKVGPNDRRLITSSNHARNLLDAVKSRAGTICPVEEAVLADALCHLGDIATRTGRKLTWDPLKEEFVNDPEANRKLKMRPRRAPYAWA